CIEAHSAEMHLLYPSFIQLFEKENPRSSFPSAALSRSDQRRDPRLKIPTPSSKPDIFSVWLDARWVLRRIRR
ncbi:hypothetical protein, partial [Faecalibaculum rodentium]|uniref:hypothetical protein n=1 Tax=Faecalibaculum rodentium TaxID=1702221 RepID=UPI0025AEAE35